MTQNIETPDSMQAAKMEIFVEECQEVIQALDAKWLEWKEDVSNLELLGEIRRGFHTLKGSGRMVEATEVADLAWGVESLLNRVLRDELEVTDTMVRVVGNARKVMLALIDKYSKGETQPNSDMNLEMVHKQIDAVSRGQQQTNPPLSPKPASVEETSPMTEGSNGDISDLVRRVDVYANKAEEALMESRRLSEQLLSLQGKTQSSVNPTDLNDYRKQVQVLAKELQKLRHVVNNNLEQLTKQAEETRHSTVIIAGAFSAVAFFLALSIGLLLK